MNLFMTVWVKQDKVFIQICTSVGSPYYMVFMPSCGIIYLLFAHWAYSTLFLPQFENPCTSLQGFRRFRISSTFKVQLPFRIIWIGIPFDFGMPFDPGIHSLLQGSPVSIFPSKEAPVSSFFGCVEVPLFNPGSGLVRVAFDRPFP